MEAKSSLGSHACATILCVYVCTVLGHQDVGFTDADRYSKKRHLQSISLS